MERNLAGSWGSSANDEGRITASMFQLSNEVGEGVDKPRDLFLHTHANQGSEAKGEHDAQPTRKEGEGRKDPPQPSKLRQHFCCAEGPG